MQRAYWPSLTAKSRKRQIVSRESHSTGAALRISPSTTSTWPGIRSASHFPAILRLCPVVGSVPTVYEVAELVNLQAVREQARRRR